MLSKASLIALALAGAAIAGPLASDVDAVPAPTLHKRLAVGQLITACTRPGVVALTFDDGPYAYTDEAIDQLNAAGMKATFFFNGDNWDLIRNRESTVRRVKNEGHQLGSHTWSHADLATLDAPSIRSEMTLLESAFVSIIGSYPTYLRPPYLGIDAESLSVLGQLGYYVIGVNIDTVDWNLQGNIPAAHQNFVNGLNSGGNMVLAHDVHRNTVRQLIPLMINTLQSRGLRSVTVGECLNEPVANWYAPPRGTTNPPPTTTTTATGTGTTSPPGQTGLPVSTDARCGAAAGFRCPASNCCSQYNWCGTSSGHCGAGCQIAYGICT